MPKRTNFVDQLNEQLHKYQIQKIQQYEIINLNHHSKQNQQKAKQELIQLADLNISLAQIDDSKIQISRWNSKKNEAPQSLSVNTITNVTNRAILKNNLILNKYGFDDQQNQYGNGYGNRFQRTQNKIERSYSTRQIPHLKSLLQKLQTPKKKTQNQKRPVTQRKYSNSQKRTKPNMEQSIYKKISVHEQDQNKALVLVQQRKSFKSLNERYNAQNKNPYPAYPVVCTKEKATININSQYKKIKRDPKSSLCGEVNQKQILQSLIKGNLNMNSNKGNQNSLSNNLNYFSSNFRNQTRKRGTLINLLY